MMAEASKQMPAKTNSRRVNKTMQTTTPSTTDSNMKAILNCSVFLNSVS